MLDSAALRARLTSVRERIERAATRAGRDPSTIRLVAISKTFPAEYVRAAADAGQRDFGENKVQEALEKIRDTSALHLTWHLVGHLQSNKARKAGASFDMIHSVDEIALVPKVDEAALVAGRHVDLLVQVDLASEATKHGARPEQVAALLQSTNGLQGVAIRGLMLLPPAVDDAREARPYFRALRTLRDELVEAGADPSQLEELSMGMSHDFEVAIEEGATIVRVGTAIFGDRTAL